MGLQSALSTALTGMTAAETTIDVVGNNVANANTIGFKESNVSFATQFLQTLSIGSAPTGSSGGTNPRQVGLGVMVAAITPDFNQGTVEISANPLDAAIQGDGFFVVQGPQGQPYYTRNGQFRTNPDNELVTLTGQRVLGFGVNAEYEIQPTSLVPLEIPLGGSAVAQATENVFLQGSLNPNGDVGTEPQIIQSVTLIDGSKEAPADVTTASSLTRPAESATATLSGGVGAIGVGQYRYRFAFVDGDGNEGPASNPTSLFSVAAPGAAIDLANLPQPASGGPFEDIAIYRSDSGGPYTLIDTVATVATGGSTSYTDVAATGSTALNQDELESANYSYYVTYYSSASGAESRPAARIGPITADETTAPRIRLDDIPKPTSGEYDGIRLYRNLSTNANAYHRIAELTPGDLAAFPADVSYIDSNLDAAVSGEPLVDLDGPSVGLPTLLTDVLVREGANYVPLFEAGMLHFAGKRGGRELEDASMEITASSTLGNLTDFMNQATGVITNPSEVPEDTFPDAPPGTVYGATIDATSSRLVVTSNMGIQNAVEIGLSAFQLTPASTNVPSSVPLAFSTVQEANGQGASADFIVYDSLGSPVRVRVSTVLEETTTTEARFRWIATSSDNEPAASDGVGTLVGTGVVVTDGNGKFVSATNDDVSIQRTTSPAASPLVFSLDFSEVTGLDNQSTASELSASRQDGFPAGTLSSFIVTETGLIQGVFTNGATRDLGQIRMARFSNNSGLEQIGDNLFSAGVNSGLPIEGNPGEQGLGGITAGAVELSNTDIGQNLIELILASTQYRGGARVITAVQELLDELLALRR